MAENLARNYEFMDEEARRKHEEELDQKIQEHLEDRRRQREQDDADLEDLKERQALRKIERAQELEEIAERMREAEIRKKIDEDEKKARAEEERLLRLERKRKTGGTSIYDVFGRGGGPTETKKDLTPEEISAMKEEYLRQNNAKMGIDGLGMDELRGRVKELYTRMVKLEAERYDLEERQKTQAYDLKELQDRQSQQFRKKAEAQGLDSEEAAKSKHPPKVKTVAKYDRQVDRRGYGERQGLFAKPNTERLYKLFHGSGKPPPEWKPKDCEEIDNIKKIFDGFKYKERVPIEGAKPPVPVIPAEIPEKDAYDEVPVQEPELPE